MIMGKSVQKNQVYNNLKVLEYSHNDKYGRKVYKFECLLCGNYIFTKGTSVKNGYTKSCGCISKNNAKTHGMHGTPLYKKWKGMKARTKSNDQVHKERYKDRGIVVCKRWEKFENFYNDMNESYVEGSELDRIDNDGNYEPSNCRWVTHKENSNNRSKYKNKTGYTGIHYRENKNQYEANVCINRKPKHIGVYKNLKDAVIARKEFIINLNKEHGTNYKYENFKN